MKLLLMQNKGKHYKCGFSNGSNLSEKKLETSFPATEARKLAKKKKKGSHVNQIRREQAAKPP